MLAGVTPNGTHFVIGLLQRRFALGTGLVSDSALLSGAAGRGARSRYKTVRFLSASKSPGPANSGPAKSQGEWPAWFFAAPLVLFADRECPRPLRERNLRKQFSNHFAAVSDFHRATVLALIGRFQ